MGKIIAFKYYSAVFSENLFIIAKIFVLKLLLKFPNVTKSNANTMHLNLFSKFFFFFCEIIFIFFYKINIEEKAGCWAVAARKGASELES